MIPLFFECLDKILIDFTKQNLIDEKNIYVNQLIQDIKLESHVNWRRSYFTQFKEVLEKNGIDSKILSGLNDYIQKFNILKAEKSETTSYINGKDDIDYGTFTKDVDFLKLEDIERVLQVIKNDKENFRYGTSIELTLRAATECPLTQQLMFFENICNVSPPLWGVYHFTETIEKLLAEWEDNPLITAWIKKNFKKIFELWLPYFLDESRELNVLTYNCKKLAETFHISIKELAPIVINSLPDIVAQLTSEQLYNLIEITSVELSKEESRDILQEILAKWNQSIKDDFGDGLFTNEKIPQRTSNETIANVFRYTLGHPDKQMRRRAAHALRRLVNYSSDSSILQILIRNQNTNTCFPFQHKAYTFYWLSSKLYLWMTINRIANENPYKLQPYVEKIINEAISPSLSHLLIQIFVKRTATVLCKTGLIQNAEDVLQKIEKPFINEVQQTLPDIIADKDNWRFDFDHLDTIPYWYNFLGRFFGLSGMQIAVLAEEFICDHWGFTGDVRDKNHVYTQDGDWSLTKNDHGSVPRIEELQTYYEYHAMFCVAGKLLKSRTIQEDKYDTFDEWLTEYATAWNNKWLSDLRDPEPLLPIMGKIDNYNENWNTTIDWEEYENYIGLSQNDYFISYSYIHKYSWKDYEAIYTKAAFVSVNKAQALLHTLSNDDNKYRYALPFDEEPEDCIQEDSFILKGLHKKIESSNGEMDDYDTLANRIDKSAILPGNLITNHFNLQLSEDFRFSYVSEHSDPVTVFENWNDTPEREHSSEESTKGGHFMIKKESLLEVMRKHDFCLILKCIVNRNKAKSYSKEKSKYSEFVSLYLIYPDGTIETARRNPTLREKDY